MNFGINIESIYRYTIGCNIRNLNVHYFTPFFGLI